MIEIGSRVTWSKLGREKVAEYFNRGFPRDGDFIVEEIRPWLNDESSVRLKGINGAVSMSWLEPCTQLSRNQ